MKLEELEKGRWEVSPKPILQPSDTGWDSHSSMTPVVFRNDEMGVASGSKYGMLYIGIGNRSNAWGIGYAASDDLKNWARHKTNPVLLQDAGTGFQLDAPCLVRADKGYVLICEEKMVEGAAGMSLRRSLPPTAKRVLRSLRRAVGLEKPTVVNHAVGKYFAGFQSKDILSWDISGKKIVFTRGQDGAFDAAGVFSPQIYRMNGEYHLFYGGTDGRKAFTGLAKSSRADSGWKRAAITPVLSPGGRGDWDEVNSLIVSVLRLEDGYCAFYEGEDCRRRYSIGMAWSKDLINWVKWERNPIIPPGRYKYCEHMVCGPRVFEAENGLFLFFNAHDRDMRGVCGLSQFRRDG